MTKIAVRHKLYFVKCIC